MPKTIDDIIPPSRRRAMSKDEQVPPPAPLTDLGTQPPNYYPPPPPPRVALRTGSSFPYGTAIIALIVVALCAGVLYAFADAEVQITPTSQTGAVSADFTAQAGSTLPFSVISVTKTASVSVPAESTETANDSAQGTIVISNTGADSEDFVTNTRFETSAGLVFRVHTPITIPGATAAGPGTLTATVYADQPGTTYDIGPSTFTVPGLESTSAYSEVTAQSSAPMVGGFTGTRAAVSQTTDDNQHAALETSLAEDLESDIAGQIPSGDVLVPGGTFTDYTREPDSATTTSNVLISEEGTVSAVVFPESALAGAIAYQIVGTYSGEPVTLSGVSGLSLDPAASTTPSGSEPFNFTLNGSTTIVWQVDTSKIAGAVAGKTRNSAQEILSGFPEVARAVLILRPFWANTFPEDPSHIKVTVETPASGS